MKFTHLFFLFLFGLSQMLNAQSNLHITFDKNPNYSSNYSEIIDFWTKVDQEYKTVKLVEYGLSDAGKPIHLVLVTNDGDFDVNSIRGKGKSILFINNAIHAGEPCGVEASMLLVRDYLEQSSFKERLKEVVIMIIPAYNIGGVLRRNSTTRANQDGPELYGFRGNAKNLDLNRDFIKCDSENAKTFATIFQEWNPDVFVDTHTSNGADYSYTISLIASQMDKMDEGMRQFMKRNMLPQLYLDMKESDWEMTPYVYARDTPDKGIAGFLDLPRYSSGYTSLFNTFSFITETHMLKPFEDRVHSTYAFLDNMVKLMGSQCSEIQSWRAKANQKTIEAKEIAINWEMDMGKMDSIFFKGYTPRYSPSLISGQDRLWYDKTQPLDKTIPYYNYYKVKTAVQKPKAYVIPQAYTEIKEGLERSGVEVQLLKHDTVLSVEMYRIEDYETSKRPYESHYLHSNVKLKANMELIQFYKGDYLVPTGQISDQFIVHVLEPAAADSYFAWNFFDGILMQKEYFSSYVFEDLAAAYLKENPELQKRLEEKRVADPEFEKSAYQQLNFVYKNSPWHEATFERYPVGRIVD